MKKKSKFLNICFSVASFIILLIFVTNIITVLGWLIKIPISKYHLLLAFIATTILNYYLQFRYKNISKYEYIVSMGIAILCFGFSLYIANLFLDISYDGGWYHSISIIRLADGWNPIYEFVNSGQFGDVYIDSYACKSIWGFGAAVYSLFGNLNSIKIISSLVSLSVIFLSISIFGNFTKNKYQLILIIILSICIGFNPIYLQQMFTNYIDSTLGLYCIFYVLLFISFYLKQNDFSNILFDVLIIACIALMTNTKLTGLFFAATFFGLYIIFKLISDIKTKNFNWHWFKKMFVTGFIGVCAAVFIGINPFITNVIHGHNMFYPILGAEKIEVMGANIPESFRSKSNLKKLILANFSETSNSTNYFDTHFLNPLQFNYITQFSNLSFDTRVGSFGALYPLIMYIVIISLLLFSKKLLKSDENSLLKKSIFLSILFILIVGILFSESWWGRYYSILWIVPLLIAIYYSLEKNKIIKCISIIIAILALINIYNVYNAIYNKNLLDSRKTTDYISTLEGKKVQFWCYDLDGKWNYSYIRYFEENNVEAIALDEPLEEYDYVGYNISIKIIEEDDNEK